MAGNIVNFIITSNVTTFQSEKRYDTSLSIGDLKNKIELITGAQAKLMKLELFDKFDKLLVTLDNNDALLSSYEPQDGMRIHATDASLSLGAFEDTTNVERFQISEEEYASRSDSLREFKKKMGQTKENTQELTEEKLRQEEAIAKNLSMGDRCEVLTQGQPPRRGEIKYVGKTSFKPGTWIGVQYDEPLGKNDGSVGGKRYFECLPKYGGFVKPNDLQVGDFPPLDELLEDDEI